MANNYIQNKSSILADEMGLGKTIQVISLMQYIIKVYSLEEEEKSSLDCVWAIPFWSLLHSPRWDSGRVKLRAGPPSMCVYIMIF